MMKTLRTLLLLALVLGVAELPAEALRRGGGFGGFRGGGGFGRSYSRPPSGGFGGFRRPQPAPAPAPQVTPPTAAPAPRPGGFGGGTRRSDPAAAGPSSINTPMPSNRPQPEVRTAPRADGPSSINTPMPSTRPNVPGRSPGGVGGQRLPGPQPVPGSLGGDVRRYPGGLSAPYGMSPWGLYPYHFLWWMGIPRPYGYVGSPAGAVLSFFVTLFLILILVAIGVTVWWMVRRSRRAADPEEARLRRWGPRES